MITMTPSAAQRIREVLEREGKSECSVRLGVAGGGCSGMSYKMEFDNKEKPGDEVFELDGIRVLVDLKSYLYLNGTELDYEVGLLAGGFKFRNPNIKRSCACGESFGI